MSDVSVIGLGDMGAALVRTLLGNGKSVSVWNRTAAKAEPLVKQGAVLAESVATAIGASPVTIVCVTDYEAARRFLETEEVAAVIGGRLLIQLTTGTPQDARDGEAWAKQHDIRYLDGAIMAMPSQVGRPDTTFLVSGPQSVFEQGEPPLRVLAGNLQYVGEEIGAAAAWDLAVLSHVFGGLLGFYHGARISEAEGIRVQDLGNMVAALAPVVGEMVQYDSASIQAEDYSNPESSLEICWKGMKLVSKQAREAGINAEFPDFLAGMLNKGMIAGFGKEKSTALMKVLRQSA